MNKEVFHKDIDFIVFTILCLCSYTNVIVVSENALLTFGRECARVGRREFARMGKIDRERERAREGKKRGVYFMYRFFLLVNFRYSIQ